MLNCYIGKVRITYVIMGIFFWSIDLVLFWPSSSCDFSWPFWSFL